MKILVRSPNWIGDQVLAYPFFHYLRAAYPRAHIAVACVPWVEAVQFRNLIDEVIPLRKPLQPTFGAKWRTLEENARELRRHGPWDLGIALPNSLSAAWVLFRAGVRRRRGYAADGRGFLLTERLPWEPSGIVHRAETYARLVTEATDRGDAAEFWGVPPENDLDPGIPGVLARFDPAAAWPDHVPAEPPIVGDYWVMAPGSTAESRRWPLEAYVSLARQILAETGLRGVIIGGPSEAGPAMQLTSDESLSLVDFVGQGSVASYWKVLARAKFVVSNDSGLAHVASLCGAPVQVVWGGGVPQRTRPIGPGKVGIQFNPVDCWPCERNTCSQPPGRKLECLRGVQPEAVWSEIQRPSRRGESVRGDDAE